MAVEAAVDPIQEIVGEMNGIPGRIGRREFERRHPSIDAIYLGPMVEERNWEQYQDAEAEGILAQTRNRFGI